MTQNNTKQQNVTFAVQDSQIDCTSCRHLPAQYGDYVRTDYTVNGHGMFSNHLTTYKNTRTGDTVYFMMDKGSWDVYGDGIDTTLKFNTVYQAVSALDQLTR